MEQVSRHNGGVTFTFQPRMTARCGARHQPTHASQGEHAQMEETGELYMARNESVHIEARVDHPGCNVT